MGSVLKAKVGEIEENKIEGRSRSMKKEVMGYVKAMVGRKILLVQLEYGQKK